MAGRGSTRGQGGIMRVLRLIVRLSTATLFLPAFVPRRGIRREPERQAFTVF
jgi:hypothetical protein